MIDEAKRKESGMTDYHEKTIEAMSKFADKWANPSRAGELVADMMELIRVAVIEAAEYVDGGGDK